jgi:hypothetical protein
MKFVVKTRWQNLTFSEKISKEPGFFKDLGSTSIFVLISDDLADFKLNLTLNKTFIAKQIMAVKERIFLFSDFGTITLLKLD